MLIIIINTLLSFVTFFLLRYAINTYDDDWNLEMGTWETTLTLGSLCVVSIVLSQLFKSYIDNICFSIFFSILFMNALTDQKTHQVYRLFSELSILLGVMYFIIKVMTKTLPFNAGIFLMMSAAYVVLLCICKLFHVMGTGDILVLIGCSFFIPVMMAETNMFIIETLLIHFIVSNVIMIVTNLTNMNWKKLKPKEEIAFIPDVFAGALIMMMTMFVCPQIYDALFVSLNFS